MLNDVMVTVVPITPMVLPPGMDKLTTLVAWITGLTSLLLFVLFIVSIGKTGIEALRRGEFSGGSSSVIILVLAVVLSAATVIFGTFSAIG